MAIDEAAREAHRVKRGGQPPVPTEPNPEPPKPVEYPATRHIFWQDPDGTDRQITVTTDGDAATVTLPDNQTFTLDKTRFFALGAVIAGVSGTDLTVVANEAK